MASFEDKVNIACGTSSTPTSYTSQAGSVNREEDKYKTKWEGYLKFVLDEKSKLKRNREIDLRVLASEISIVE